MTVKGMVKRLAHAAGIRRETVAWSRLAVERHALARLGRRPARQGGRVLCYHAVGEPALGVNNADPKRFRAQLQQALDLGYRFVPAATIGRGEGQDKDLAVTFDDGWRSVASQAAPVLAEMGIPWTLFVVTRWSDHAEDWTRDRVLGWDDLGALASAGVELGSHSVNHPDFSMLPPNEVDDELRQSREAFRQRLGFVPSSFAIPFGQSKNWNAPCQSAALAAGYDLVYAQAEETRQPGTVPRTFVTTVDNPTIFKALLEGAFDRWEEWY